MAKTLACNLNVGTVMLTGEKIVKIEKSQHSSKPEATVVLEKDGKYRTAWWGWRTLVSHR